MECWRKALAIVKGWKENPDGGRRPVVRRLRMRLSTELSYRVKDGYVEIAEGVRLRILGRDRCYDRYPNGEARLVYRNGEMFLHIVKQIPRPRHYAPQDIIAVDVNERKVVFGNGKHIESVETAIGRATRYVGRSAPKYKAWLRRKGILKRIKEHHRRARNILLD